MLMLIVIALGISACVWSHRVGEKQDREMNAWLKKRARESLEENLRHYKNNKGK